MVLSRSPNPHWGRRTLQQQRTHGHSQCFLFPPSRLLRLLVRPHSAPQTLSCERGRRLLAFSQAQHTAGTAAGRRRPQPWGCSGPHRQHSSERTSSKAIVSCLGKQWFHLKCWGQRVDGGQSAGPRAPNPEGVTAQASSFESSPARSWRAEGPDRLCPVLSQDGRAGQVPHRSRAWRTWARLTGNPRSILRSLNKYTCGGQASAWVAETTS